MVNFSLNSMKLGTVKFWKWGLRREGFKFTVYVVVPVLCGFVYANPKVMNDLIMKMRLIEYPESAPAPPVGDEINSFRAKRVLRDLEKKEGK